MKKQVRGESMKLMLLMTMLSFQVFATESKKENSYPVVPKLKTGEYALFLNDKYTIFKTQKTDGLELDLSCYKKNKPECQAFAVSKNRIEDVQIKKTAMNNMAALHCAKVSGQNVIAIDSRQNEKDFCRFSDNSMVSSWSLYFQNSSSVKTK